MQHGNRNDCRLDTLRLDIIALEHGWKDQYVTKLGRILVRQSTPGSHATRATDKSDWPSASPQQFAAIAFVLLVGIQRNVIGIPAG
jgi:hypothetical protein